MSQDDVEYLEDKIIELQKTIKYLTERLNAYEDSRVFKARPEYETMRYYAAPSDYANYTIQEITLGETSDDEVPF